MGGGVVLKNTCFEICFEIILLPTQTMNVLTEGMMFGSNILVGAGREWGEGKEKKRK